jgi:hypothetical protein
MAVLEELAVLLGFKVEGDQNLSRFERGLSNVDRKVTTAARNISKYGAIAAGAFAAIGAGMFKLASDAAGPLDEIGKAADRIGITVEQVQRLGFAAEQAGSSQGEMTSALETMTGRLAEAARGSGRAKTVLDAYGMSATDATGKVKDANVFFLELADHMQTMSEAESLDLAQKLGLSRGLVTLLRSGRDAIQADGDLAEASGFIFGRQATDNAEAYNNAFGLLKRTIEGLKTAIGVELLPVMTQAIGVMQNWINANGEFIRQKISEVIGSIVGHFETIAKMDASTLNKFAWAFGVILFFAFPLASKLVIIAVAVEDILKHMGGGESVIGSFITWFKDLTGASDALANSVAALVAGLAALMLMKPGATIKAIGKMIGGAAGMVGGAAAGAGATATGAAAGAGSPLASMVRNAVAFGLAGLGIHSVAKNAATGGGDITPDSPMSEILQTDRAKAIADWIKETFTPSAPMAKDYPAGHPLHQSTRTLGNMDAATAAQSMSTTNNTSNEYQINIEQTFNGSTTTAGQVRAGGVEAAKEIFRSLGTTAPSPAQ